MSKQRSIGTAVRSWGVAMGVLAAACSGGPADETGAAQEPLTAVASFGSNPGRLSMYEYAPAGVPANAPLVVAMHGCTQSAEAYVGAGWNQLADTWKFYVVYPQQSSSNNSNKCFQWWDAASTSRDAGEALSIKQMVDSMKARHSIDASRVFVTGLSAGAAMTSVMLAAYPDVFSAGAIMAGLPYRCASSTSDAYTCMGGSVDKTPAQWGALVRAASKVVSAPPRVSIWQGTSDYTVRPANATELVDQWTDVNGVDATADRTETVKGATHAVYEDGSGSARVERWLIPNMGHGTAIEPGLAAAGGCGTAGAYILSVGICSTYYAGLFFGLGTPAAVSDAGAPDAAPVADAGAPRDAGSDAAAFACKTWDATVYAHVTAGRAVRCGLANSYACAVGSGERIGLWNLLPATLRETRAGYYEVGACP